MASAEARPRAAKTTEVLSDDNIPSGFSPVPAVPVITRTRQELELIRRVSLHSKGRGFTLKNYDKMKIAKYAEVGKLDFNMVSHPSHNYSLKENLCCLEAPCTL